MASRVIRPHSAKPGALQICAECRGLHGAYTEYHPDAVQSCHCSRRTPPVPCEPVGRADHCTYAELCRCCALVLLPSGSRFSVWLCEACGPLVKGLNRAVGRAIVPIGRHSLMAGVGLRGGRDIPPQAVEAFTTASIGLFDRIGQLEEYARSVVGRNLELLGFEPGAEIYLGEYLHAVRRSQLRCDDAFFDLLFDFALAGTDAA